MASLEFQLGARVQCSSGSGRVKYSGQTSFAAGKWVGIELDEGGAGKNDGSVQASVHSPCAILHAVVYADGVPFTRRIALYASICIYVCTGQAVLCTRQAGDTLGRVCQAIPGPSHRRSRGGGVRCTRSSEGE